MMLIGMIWLVHSYRKGFATYLSILGRVCQRFLQGKSAALMTLSDLGQWKIQSERELRKSFCPSYCYEKSSYKTLVSGKICLSFIHNHYFDASCYTQICPFKRQRKTLIHSVKAWKYLGIIFFLVATIWTKKTCNMWGSRLSRFLKIVHKTLGE